MAKATSGSSYIKKPKKRGVAAKNQTSTNKASKLYKKAYRGQGR
jgi:hypothetical protein